MEITQKERFVNIVTEKKPRFIIVTHKSKMHEPRLIGAIISLKHFLEEKEGIFCNLDIVGLEFSDGFEELLGGHFSKKI